jgi:tetratricopeptide (TPR) repeat protein
VSSPSSSASRHGPAPSPTDSTSRRCTRHDRAEAIRGEAIAAAPDPEAAGARFASLVFMEPWTRGRYEEAIAMVEAVVAAAPQALPLRGLLALLYLEAGEVEPARARFEALAREGFPFEPDEFLVVGLTQTALACSYLGDRERARTLHERLLPFEARNAAIGEQAVTNGPVALHLGALEVTLGHWDRATRRLLLAEQLARAWGHAAGVADAMLHRGQLMAMRGEEGGPALIESALEQAETHGIARIAATAEQLAAYWPAAATERRG